jgi:serine/threonine protein phosphatase 1
MGLALAMRPDQSGVFATMAQVRPAASAHTIYAVGDIHGRADLLDDLLGQIAADAALAAATSSLVFVGDYVDRGPQSKTVLDRLLAPPEGFEVHYLRGNHDQALLDFLGDYSTYPKWQRFGADETLKSYGVAPPVSLDDNALADLRDSFACRLPGEHLWFLEMLKPSVQIGQYYFVHAGVRPGVPLEDQALDDMMWIREDFLESKQDFGKVIVHGHTPVDSPVCRSNRIGIDTGAFATGCLTAVVLDGTGARFLSTR